MVDSLNLVEIKRLEVRIGQVLLLRLLLDAHDVVRRLEFGERLNKVCFLLQKGLSVDDGRLAAAETMGDDPASSKVSGFARARKADKLLTNSTCL